MSFYSNQNFQINGDVVTSFDVIKKSEAIALRNSKGSQDFSTLATWVDLDPMKNMLKLETAWNKQSIERVGLFQDSIKNDAVLEVNGEAGEFHYQMPVETDNCMKTVEDTSSQAVDGGVGSDGTPFRLVLNKMLAPNAQISADGMDGDTLVISDIYPVSDLGYGFEHWVTLMKSHSDPDVTYDPSLLESNREYFEISSSAVGEYTEQLSPVHMPSGTNYITCKFKLGAGQGVETFSTGTANSVSLMPGYTTADTQEYINEVMGEGYDPENDVVIGMTQDKSSKSGYKYTVGSLLENLAIKKFKQNFNRSLMFMEGGAISTTKGVLTYNEGLWRQMLRGFVHNYARRGAFNFEDLKILRDYVFQGNPGLKIDQSVMRIKAGTDLYDNLEVLIQTEAGRQLTNLAPLLGADQVTSQKIVTGALDNLEVALVKFGKVRVPGIGLVEAMLDTTMDYVRLTDRQLRGVATPGGRDYSSWSGIIWDVTDQMYSNNKKLPAGTKAINDKVKANIYMVRPQGDSIFWGRENGRYSSKGASDILASGKTRHESFFMYGFGAMWMADPSKFAMTQVKRSARVGTN
jgi:hypothetical protein